MKNREIFFENHQHYCNHFYTVCYDFLNKRNKEKGYRFNFFVYKENEEQIAKNTLDAIKKVKIYSHNNKIKLDEVIELFNIVNAAYDRLKKIFLNNIIQRKTTDHDLRDICYKMFTLLQSLYYFLTQYADLKRRDGKLSSFDNCLNHPRGMSRTAFYLLHYSNVKKEVSDAAHHYLIYYPNTGVSTQVRLILESVENDHAGVNQYTTFPDRQFLNILKFINTHRLILIGREEQILSAELTRMIERYLKIVNDDVSRSWLIETNKVDGIKLNLSNAINKFEKIITDDSVVHITQKHRAGFFDIGTRFRQEDIKLSSNNQIKRIHQFSLE